MSFSPSVRVLLVLAVCAGLSSYASAPARAQDEPVLDEIVAIVGSDVVLKSDVDALVSNFLQQQKDAKYSDELWTNALDELINQKVMAETAKRDTTITVTNEQVEQQLDQRVEQLTRQMGTQARVEEAYGASIAELRTDLRPELKNQLLAQQLQQRKMSQIKITPSEVKEWFAQFPTDSLPVLPEYVRVSHIVKYPEPTAEARQEAIDILTVIRDSIVVGGASFEEMAQQFSDDLSSAPNGGHMENWSLDDLVPEFAAVVARSPIGEVSKIFESPFGYHILRVNSRRGKIVDFNHILIKVDDSNYDPTAAIDALNAIRDSLLTTDIPFEVMARRHSEEDASSIRGGRVVDLQSGESDLFVDALGPEWQATLDTMTVGEISKPARITLQNGRTAYHIVQLLKHVDAHQWNLDADYERIKQFALQQKRQDVLKEWLQELREKVYVDLRGKAKEMRLANR